jgi:hypothetical protein
MFAFSQSAQFNATVQAPPNKPGTSILTWDMV